MNPSDAPGPAAPAPPSRVAVTDIDMPFWSMVAFMIKWTIAAIPALLILIVVGSVFSVFVAGMIAGLGSLSSSMVSSTRDSGASDSTPASPLVVSVGHTVTGWEVTTDSTEMWRQCRLSIGGSSVEIPEFSSLRPTEVPGYSVLGRIDATTVSMECRVPQYRKARVYVAK